MNIKIEGEYRIITFENGAISREYIGNEDINNNIQNNLDEYIEQHRLEKIIFEEKLDYLTTLLEMRGI